jgi:hypothetical protein
MWLDGREIFTNTFAGRSPQSELWKIVDYVACFENLKALKSDALRAPLQTLLWPHLRS